MDDSESLIPHDVSRIKQVFVALWIAAIVTSPLIVPYFMALNAIADHPRPLPAFWLPLILLRAAVVGAVVIPLGLWLSAKVGLGAPYLEHRLYGTPAPAPSRSIVGPAVFWAVATALIAFAIDAIFYYGLGVNHPAPEIHARIPGVSPWAGLLASFGAPIDEEVTYRLFLTSLIAWVVLLASGRVGRPAALWIANVVSAVMFGWAHMGGVEIFGPAPALAWLRTFLVILAPGLAFGWLFIKRGLEAAILSHFVIDIIVHVIRPLVDPGA
ncbi:MAG: hypothetical protein DMF86_16385 [Acidobacteria bacterium]|nr:MAG: hypothetical protein DMF86_16385 [Acidobacteriota bacterium]